MKVSICLAGSMASRRQIEAMLPAYLDELQQYGDAGNEAGPSYPYLPLYWQSPNRFPYLLLADDETAGFALVREEVSGTNGEPLFELAEFFVVPGWRRQTLGQATFRLLLSQHPGQWQLGVLAGNSPALTFWQETFKTLGLVVQQGKSAPGWLFEFSSDPSPGPTHH